MESSSDDLPLHGQFLRRYLRESFDYAPQNYIAIHHLGVAEGTLTRWLRGQQSPSHQSLRSIARSVFDYTEEGTSREDHERDFIYSFRFLESFNKKDSITEKQPPPMARDFLFDTGLLKATSAATNHLDDAEATPFLMRQSDGVPYINEESSSTQLRRLWRTPHVYLIPILLVVLLTATLVTVRYCQDYLEMEEYREWEEKATKERIERDRQSRIAKMDIGLKFREIAVRVLKISVSRLHLPEGATVQFSLNKGPFEEDQGEHILRADDILEFPLTLEYRIFDSQGQFITSLDKTAELYKYLGKDLSRRGGDRINSGWACTFSGCNWKLGPMCSHFVQKATLKYGGRRFQLDLKRCSTSYCIANRDLPFDLIPGTNVSLSLGLKDGETREFLIPIGYTQGLSDEYVKSGKDYGRKWYILPRSEGDKGVRSPVVASSFEPENMYNYRGTWWFRVGTPGCDAGGDSTILLDTDGERAINVGYGGDRGVAIQLDTYRRNQRDQLRLPLERTEISIYYTLANSAQREGPYYYTFDPIKIIERTAAFDENPEVECVGDTNVYGVAAKRVCYARNRFLFYRVRSVLFGVSPNELSIKQDIDFDASEYIMGTCQSSVSGKCAPFRHKVPNGLTDYYSQIILKDGTNHPVIRHKLQ